LGVTIFCIATVHGVFSILQFHTLGNVNPFVSLFTSNTNFNSIGGFPSSRWVFCLDHFISHGYHQS
jgi:hypothetical protein